MWKLFARLGRDGSEDPMASTTTEGRGEHRSHAALTSDSQSQGTLSDPQPGSRFGLTGSKRNRRTSNRFRAIRDQLWMGWWEDEEFVLLGAQLVNISEGGVLVSLDQAPLEGRVVWMRLNEVPANESACAKVLEARWVTLRQRYLVRLRFERRCPTTFYESAVFGT